MKIVALIPARGGSKTIPMKNLALLAGKPLMQYAIEAAKGSCIDDVYVSTDNRDISAFSMLMKTKVLPRPEELARDNSTTESVMLHFADMIDFDLIVLIQATSPLIEYSDIDSGIKKYLSGRYDSVISVADVPDMLIWDEKTKTPINYDIYDRGNRQTRKTRYVIETGGFYITDRKTLLKTKCRCGGRIGFSFISYWKSFEVDTLSDLVMIESLLTIRK